MAQKWILITGGSRGIGRALVTGLAQSWNVVFTGRDEEAMNATLAECENSSHQVRGYACRDRSRRPAYSPERRALARGFGHQCDFNA